MVKNRKRTGVKRGTFIIGEKKSSTKRETQDDQSCAEKRYQNPDKAFPVRHIQRRNRQGRPAASRYDGKIRQIGLDQHYAQKHRIPNQEPYDSSAQQPQDKGRLRLKKLKTKNQQASAPINFFGGTPFILD
jgi:hypothetical protein